MSDPLPKATRPIALLLLLALNLVQSGCGPPTSPYPSARVAGEVTLDGQPIESGNISFIPQGRGQSRPAAADFQDGTYKVNDTPLGEVRVFITATKETGKMIPGSGEPVPEVINVIPPQYRQGIEIEIEGDNDALDFHLTSQ